MLPWTFISLVGIGGAIGAAARYVVTSRMTPLVLAFNIPLATLMINIGGSFLMGMLMGGLTRDTPGGYANSALYLFFGVGVLGGFTTFSAFSLDIFQLIEEQRTDWALGYALVSVMGSVAGLWLGLWLIRRAFG